MVGWKIAGTMRRWIVIPLTVCAVLACEGKQRAFLSSTDELSPDSAVARPGETSGTPVLVSPDSTLEPRLLPLGEGCDNPRSCASGHCVDGVCCDAACTDLCATCAAPGSEGTCSAAASDAACQPLNCPISTECRSRDQTALALNCDAVGKCRSDATCEPLDAPSGTPCGGGTGACDGQGACAVPGKVSLGGACTSADDCAEEIAYQAQAGPGFAAMLRAMECASSVARKATAKHFPSTTSAASLSVAPRTMRVATIRIS